MVFIGICFLLFFGEVGFWIEVCVVFYFYFATFVMWVVEGML